MTRNGVTKVPDSLAACVIPAAANAGAFYERFPTLAWNLQLYERHQTGGPCHICGPYRRSLGNRDNDGKFDRTPQLPIWIHLAQWPLASESPVHRSNHEPDLPRAKLTENPTALELDGARGA